jgi:hypothetical protein
MIWLIGMTHCGLLFYFLFMRNYELNAAIKRAEPTDKTIWNEIT